MNYQERGKIIEAMRLKEPHTPSEVAEWCHGQVCGVGNVGAKVWIDVPTKTGVVRVDYGDYVIRGKGGDFYPCESDVFDRLYGNMND